MHLAYGDRSNRAKVASYLSGVLQSSIQGQRMSEIGVTFKIYEVLAE